jgi:GNAT superfamily N-acetyltransferase
MDCQKHNGEIMTVKVTVRKLDPKDELSMAVKLLQRFFREEGFETPDTVIESNTHILAGVEQCGLFIAETNETCIGVATVSLDFGIEFGWSAEIGDLYVLPEWRGRGVSRKLVEAIESFLREKGATEYRVTVTSFGREQHDLVSFYNSLGLVDEGRQLMQKSLAQHA